ncbi:MAG: hypothetical protein IPJ39_03355 [Saprospiraceae bacterium]|nr:hypothetical protein [Saprospiraceae bacterium]
MENINEIIINEIDSYPEDLIKLLKSCEKDLSRYLKEEQRICNLHQDPNPVINKYKANWNLSIGKIEKVLIENRFVGFHCSRLTDKEIGIISKKRFSSIIRTTCQRKSRKGF